MGNARIRHSLTEFAKGKIHALCLKMGIRPAEIFGPLAVVNEGALVESPDMRGVAVCTEAEIVRHKNLEQPTRLEKVETIPHGTYKVRNVLKHVISCDALEVPGWELIGDREGYIHNYVRTPSRLGVDIKPTDTIVFTRT